jgi:hypothetical protein
MRQEFYESVESDIQFGLDQIIEQTVYAVRHRISTQMNRKIVKQKKNKTVMILETSIYVEEASAFEVVLKQAADKSLEERLRGTCLRA